MSAFRARFRLPPDVVYMMGNSLGPLSVEAEAALLLAIEEWQNLGVSGWTEASPPWLHLAEHVGAMTASLVGAEPDEIVATGGTTLNLHALVSTLYTPAGRRTKILADALAFPSTIYALRGQIALRGLDPARHLVLVPSEDGDLLDEDRIARAMTEEIALALFPSVVFRSGQLLDMARLTRDAHRMGILIGFDCAHSVGALPHSFDAAGVDFGVWCSYKHLNAGPGSPGFLYLNRRHFERTPRLAGWFGCAKESQFALDLEFENARSASGFQISTPGILGLATARGALSVLCEAGIDRIREKSLSLTSLLMEIVDESLSRGPFDLRIPTPRDPARRGGHVAVERDEGARELQAALRRNRIVCDFRPPNVIRLAPNALYNTHEEVWRVAETMRRVLADGSFAREPAPHVNAP